MNYFELYELPVSFNPDQGKVKQQFYALSKKFHPDFYINTSQEKQDEVLGLATENNKAYKVLANPQLRLQYILQLYDLLPEGENYILPQSFLMEMMDVNEALMELEFEPDPAVLVQLTESVDQIEAGLKQELDVLTIEFESAGEESRPKILLKIKDLFYRTKYLIRIRESLSKHHN